MEQEDFKRKPFNNKIIIGLALIAGGILLFAKKLGIVFFPGWIFTWPVALIGIGFLVGIQHKFKTFWWIIMIVAGCFWLLQQQMPQLNLYMYSTPFWLVIIGLFFIFRQKNSRSNRWNSERWKNISRNNYYSDNNNVTTENAEFIDSTSVFSGAKKVIISKNFKGGDITCFMGGAEVDLSQADIQGTAVIDATAVFGGIKLIVPSNWDLKIENNAVFGNVEDKRRLQSFNADPSKQLVIDGTAVFGGIEIVNF